MKKLFKILICLLIFIIFEPVLIAAPIKAVSGTIKISEYRKGNKKASEMVDYLIYGNKSRIQATDKVYYIIDLDTEKTRVVNDRRKKITITYASSILEHSLPPLVILKSRSSLKNYLASINATLETVMQVGLKNFELWQFNIGNAFYKVKVKLPEYYPQEIEIITKNRKTIIEVLEKKEIPVAEFNKALLQIPGDYKVVDLIKK